jgi:hypothetical protein
VVEGESAVAILDGLVHESVRGFVWEFVGGLLERNAADDDDVDPSLY